MANCEKCGKKLGLTTHYCLGCLREQARKKGIEKLYADVILTNDFSEVENNYKRFFGYIQKSKNSKEKWKDEPD